jgi:hypothetical protein
MIIDQESNHSMKPVVRLIEMNYHVSRHADYYLEKKKKAEHQSPSQEEEEESKDDAQKNHCVKERVRAKERPASAEKLGPRNKTTHKLISKSLILLINIERRWLLTRYNF